MIRRTVARGLLVAWAMILTTGPASAGDPAAENPKVAARNAHKEALRLRANATDLLSRNSKVMGNDRKDLEAVVAAKRDEANAFDKLATALVAGDAEKIAAAMAEREKATGVAVRAGRLWWARDAQFKHVNILQALEKKRSEVPAGAREKFEALLAARKAAAAAWGSVADALGGSSSSKDVEPILEKARAAETEARVADQDLGLSIDTLSLTDAGSSSSEVKEKLEALKSVDLRIVAVKREGLQLEFKREALREAISDMIESARKSALKPADGASPAAPGK